MPRKMRWGEGEDNVDVYLSGGKVRVVLHFRHPRFVDLPRDSARELGKALLQAAEAPERWEGVTVSAKEMRETRDIEGLRKLYEHRDLYPGEQPEWSVVKVLLDEVERLKANRERLVRHGMEAGRFWAEHQKDHRSYEEAVEAAVERLREHDLTRTGEG